MADTWIDELIPLPRPEYAKQTESLLTDLLWRSRGSSLSDSLTGKAYLPELAGVQMERLVPSRARGKHEAIIETLPMAEAADVSSLVSTPAGSEPPTKALLNSIVAPRSSGDRSLACVPINPDSVVLQTLHGLVNKKDPPNMANAIEALGRLGGSGGHGHVAFLLLQAFSTRVGVRNGLAGLVDTLFPVIAEQVWEQLKSKRLSDLRDAFLMGKITQEDLESQQAAIGNLPDWRGVTPRLYDTADNLLLTSYELTPFKWFWSKWSTLCDPTNGWYDALPARRFMDWALCLLRTGLAFAYLWEAEFFVRLYECIVQLQDAAPGARANMTRLQSMLEEDLVLATIESPLVPASQKHAWTALASLIARGYLARENIKRHLQDIHFPIPAGRNFIGVIEEWVNSLDSEGVKTLSEPLVVKDFTANNQREFVRYLLRPRASDDDAADQADFYYLAQTNKANKFWFQPGPEWLVVVTSLLGKRSGGRCTLGMLLGDLRALGIKVDRWVLIGMLEESGLSTDSPDADDAIVIKASF